MEALLVIVKDGLFQYAKDKRSSSKAERRYLQIVPTRVSAPYLILHASSGYRVGGRLTNADDPTTNKVATCRFETWARAINRRRPSSPTMIVMSFACDAIDEIISRCARSVKSLVARRDCRRLNKALAASPVLAQLERNKEDSTPEGPGPLSLTIIIILHTV